MWIQTRQYSAKSNSENRISVYCCSCKVEVDEEYAVENQIGSMRVHYLRQLTVCHVVQLFIKQPVCIGLMAYSLSSIALGHAYGGSRWRR